MSDDFDKEAEREKLREKYERDQQKREATEQMSELLLQGATMTNAHCSECGDPIFRYDGQEFCPTCEKPVDRDTAGEDEEGEEDDDQIEVTTASDEAKVAFGEDDADNGAGAGQDGTEQPQDATGVDARRERTQPAQEPQRERAAGRQADNLPTQHEQELPNVEQEVRKTDRTRARASPDPPQTGDASVTAARESLVRTLTRFSRLAEGTEDPRQAQEHLAAAREAADALAELRR